MTLSSVMPKTVSTLLTYLGGAVSDINSLWARYSSDSWIANYKEQALETNIIEASDVPIEVLAVTSAFPMRMPLSTITGGRKGMLKILLFDDSYITVAHHTDPIAGNIRLKGALDIFMQTGDVLVIVNRDGDPATRENGYWIEILRSLY